MIAWLPGIFSRFQGPGTKSHSTTIFFTASVVWIGMSTVPLALFGGVAVWMRPLFWKTTELPEPGVGGGFEPPLSAAVEADGSRNQTCERGRLTTEAKMKNGWLQVTWTRASEIFCSPTAPSVSSNWRSDRAKKDSVTVEPIEVPSTRKSLSSHCAPWL